MLCVIQIGLHSKLSLCIIQDYVCLCIIHIYLSIVSFIVVLVSFGDCVYHSLGEVG